MAFLNSLGTSSSSQMLVRSEWSASRATGPADLKISVGIQSIPGVFSRAGLYDCLQNFFDRWGEVEAGDHGLLWDLVEHSGVHSGGSVEQGTEVFPPPCVDSALLLKQG